jgi:hypothetical protein
MNKFIIREVQNRGSFRQGYEIQAKSLTQAKMVASKRQYYHGTVLVIENENGTVLAEKFDDKWWDKL